MGYSDNPHERKNFPPAKDVFFSHLASRKFSFTTILTSQDKRCPYNTLLMTTRIIWIHLRCHYKEMISDAWKSNAILILFPFNHYVKATHLSVYRTALGNNLVLIIIILPESCSISSKSKLRAKLCPTYRYGSFRIFFARKYQ